MNGLLTIVGYEYKKIISKKTFLVAVLLMLFVSTFCMVGHSINGGKNRDAERLRWNSSAVAENRELVEAVSGPVDETMVDGMIRKNFAARKLLNEDGYPAAVYLADIGPYALLQNMMTYLVGYDAFNKLESGEGIDVYSLREQVLKELMSEKKFSQDETQAMLEKNAQVETPFFYGYYEGYTNFLITMGGSAIFIVLGAVICTAPIFAGEYAWKTDAVLLSAKLGKKKLITAKLITALSFSIIFTVLGLLIAILVNFGLYGYEGGDTSWQIFNVFSVYPLTVLKVFAIYCGIVVLASCTICAVVALLSAYTNTFFTLVLTVLALFLSMILKLGPFNYLLPGKMLDAGSVFDNRLANFFGIHMEPYLLIPCLCVVVLIIAVPLAARGFRRHQVG